MHGLCWAALGDATANTLHIGELRLRDLTLDFYDASVAAARGTGGMGGAPHRIRLDALRADLILKIMGLDLVALQPYLLPANEASVTRGTLDLALDAKAIGQRLNAPGRLTLEGKLDDPKFSLNELFAARFAVSLAEKLGVSLSGMVEGVGSAIKGLCGR